MDHSNMNTENKEEKPAEDKEVNIRPTSNTEKINKNEFTLTAQERKHTLTDKKK